MLKAIAVASAVVLTLLSATTAMAQAISGAREAGTRYAAAFTSGDVETAASFFARDGVAFPLNCGEISGRDQMRDFFTRLFRSGSKLTSTPESTVQISDTAVREIGAFHLTMRGQGGRAVDGKYITVWVKHEKGWEIAIEMWKYQSAASGNAPDGDERSQSCMVGDS